MYGVFQDCCLLIDKGSPFSHLPVFYGMNKSFYEAAKLFYDRHPKLFHKAIIPNLSTKRNYHPKSFRAAVIPKSFYEAVIPTQEGTEILERANLA